MEIIVPVVYTVIFLFSAWIAVKKQTHMFQLNSYAAKSYHTWLTQHRTGWFANLIPALVMLTGAFVRRGLVFAPVSAAVMLPLAWISRETDVKKPLVYTPRVIRLFVTMGLIAAGFTAGFWTRGAWETALCAQALLFAFVPLWILCANLMNTPVEYAVRLRYILEAKRILRNASGMQIIGVTGSFGKTSVKYFLTSILRARYDVLMTPGNYNTTMGVVRTVREQYTPTNQIFVCEMGARHVGDIREICQLVRPGAGIITAVGPQHLETFRTLDNIRRTKFELADALPDAAPLFLNADDENVMSMVSGTPPEYIRETSGRRAAKTKPSVILYGVDHHAGYYADEIRVSEQGTSFTLHTPDGESVELTTRLLGRHNVLNLTGAAAAAHTFGVTLNDIALRVRRIESVPHRLQILRNPEGAIIDDAYNSNPEGARAALEALSMFDGLKILVTPGMVELGERQDECNFTFGQQAAKVCDLVVLVGAQQTKAIRDGLARQRFPQQYTIVTENLREAMEAVRTFPSHGKKKYILLENDLPDNYSA